MSEICTRCGGASQVARGDRECVASWDGENSKTTWSIAVCRSCGLEDVAEDRHKTKWATPLKGALLAVLGLGVCAVALISLTEPGWWKLWAIPFAFLGIPAAMKGLAFLVTMPMALSQLRTTAENLENDTLTDKDRDLLVHLEAHRILETLRGEGGWVHGDLRLPETPGAKPKLVTYSLLTPSTEKDSEPG